MSVEKINFEELIQDNILFYKDMHLDVISDNKAWFGNLTLSHTLQIKDNGIQFFNYNNIEILSPPPNRESEKFSFKYLVQTREYNIQSLKFNDCIFEKEPIFQNKNITSVEFYDCEFNCDIYNLLKKYDNYSLKIKFDNCKFSRIGIWDISNDFKINFFELYGGSIKYLEITKEIIHEEFYINKQSNDNQKNTKIMNLKIKNSTFKKNFKLHHCNVENIQIQDVTLKKQADFYLSNFKQELNDDENQNLNINFTNIDFNGLAIFGNCTFQEKVIFKWITFEDFCHFREATFDKGLDLDYTNIQKEMNFFDVKGLDTKESIKETSQETYRIIKHNFENIGNKVEANKYHALELEKRMKNENITGFNKIVLTLNFIVSNNGTNWIKPLLFILLIGFLTTIGIHSSQFIDFVCQPLEYLSYIPKGLNELFQHIYILTKYKDLWNTFPNAMILAFNKFSLGYLYYQFLISVRKDTRK